MTRSLSYSRARAFDECAAKYHAEYELGQRPAADEPHLIMGTLIHEVADRYVQHLRAQKAGSDFDVLTSIAATVWANERAGLSYTYREEFDALVDRLRQELVFEDIGSVVSCEMRVAVDRDWKPCDYDGPSAYVRGRIDRVDRDADGHLTVVDYKTGHVMESIEASMQMKLYASIAKAMWPDAEAIDVELQYLRHGVVKKGRITEASINYGREWITAVGDAIELARQKNEWPARPGAACRGCAAFNGCLARTTAVKILPPQDEEQAHRLVERMILVEREQKELKEALRPWLDQVGWVEVNGMVLTMAPEIRREFDTVRVAELLEARGMRPLDFLKVNTTAIKKVARRDLALAQELDQLAEDTSITKMKLVRQGTEE